MDLHAIAETGNTEAVNDLFTVGFSGNSQVRPAVPLLQSPTHLFQSVDRVAASFIVTAITQFSFLIHFGTYF